MEIKHHALATALVVHEHPSLCLNETTVVPWINHLLTTAIRQRASDIHFEPYEDNYRVRFRFDGLLSEVAHPPPHLAARITARIKVLANLNTSERRLPQDGRFHMQSEKDHRIDFRVNSCPTLHGEKIVIRILDAHALKLDISALGLNHTQHASFLRALTKPQGMIILTGPTGSGKTSSLYAALNFLNCPEKNIVTVEDPVEIKLPGVNQIQVNPGIDLTFATALRALLRQDPDIMMVGEIRDKETAEIALKASQTGHLVLSTLHTNSAADTFTRLRMMGVKPFQLMNSINLVIAQRLVRRLCIYCRVAKDLTLHHPALNVLNFPVDTPNDALQVYQAKGCQHCNKGYYGRIGVFEVMPMSSRLETQIQVNAEPSSILAQAQSEGMQTLWEMGLSHVRSGLTTLEEINRVLIH